jgi:hypothetical protein
LLFSSGAISFEAMELECWLRTFARRSAIDMATTMKASTLIMANTRSI